MPMPPASGSPSSQPAWPPRLSFSSRSGPVEPPNGTAALRRRQRLGPPAWPSRRPKPLYSRIRRETLLSVGARDPRAARGRRQFDQQRPGERHREQRRARRQQLADRGSAAARRDPEPGQRHPRHDHQRHAHLRLEAEADADARQDQPAGAAVLQRPHERPQGADAAEDEQRVGVVVAGDGDRDRGQRQDEAGDEPRRAAEAAPRQVVEEPDRGDAHQRLRHQDAHELKPKALTESACTQSASGGLSTVISPWASKEPKRKLCQLPLIERTAAL